jgi:hypothetical protein
MSDFNLAMIRRRHGWDGEKLRRGDSSPTSIKQYHAQRGQLLEKIDELEAELELEQRNHDETIYRYGPHE